MAKGRGTGPAVNLDSSIDGEGQEGVGRVEDVDQCQGHKGLLSIQHVCVVHQGVDSKHDKCDLKGSKGQQSTCFRMVQGWQALQDSGTHLVKPRQSPLGACPAGTTGKGLVCWWQNQVWSLHVCSALRRFWCSSHSNSCDLQADIIFSCP